MLIIADNPLARAGLAALLSDQTDCTVVGQVTGDSHLPPSMEAFRPDVLLWDMGWDTTVTLESLADLRGRH